VDRRGAQARDARPRATAAEDGLVGHLGPDVLGDDWDPQEALRRLRADPDRTIGEALLDQRNLAGVGTFSWVRASSCAG
jgi:formamidopyrimidine-DNA glycosylase